MCALQVPSLLAVPDSGFPGHEEVKDCRGMRGVVVALSYLQLRTGSSKLERWPDALSGTPEVP